MMDAFTTFIELFGLDASSIPQPVLAVIGYMLLLLFVCSMLDIFSHLFRS